jgi:hypothetical protein
MIVTTTWTDNIFCGWLINAFNSNADNNDGKPCRTVYFIFLYLKIIFIYLFR